MGVAQLYAGLIRKGIKTSESIPHFIKDDVEEILKDKPAETSLQNDIKEDVTNDNDK